MNTQKSRCEWCERLCSIFRAKKHYLDKCKKKKTIKRLGSTLTPNRKNMLLGIQKKKIHLKKSNLRYIILYAICIYSFLNITFNNINGIDYNHL